MGVRTEDGAEEWTFLEMLGEGGYGEVHRARRRADGAVVAVKKMAVYDTTTDCMANTEATVMKRLQHPNITKLNSYKRTEDRDHVIFWMELEFAPGGDLYNYLDAHTGISKMSTTKKLFKQLLSGVEHMHKFGVAHRDIKPENLLLDADLNIKIADFGLAAIFRVRGMESKVSGDFGSPSYQAPEMLTDDEYSATPVDIWACGIVLIQMLVGINGKPWWTADTMDPKYQLWVERKYDSHPWTAVDSTALSLLKRMLEVRVEGACRRAEIREILGHPFVVDNEEHYINEDEDSAPAPKRHRC